MSEESESEPPSVAQEVLSLVVVADGLLQHGPFETEKALVLRHHLYDVMKRLEKAPSVTGPRERLLRLATYSFICLQERLTSSDG